MEPFEQKLALTVVDRLWRLGSPRQGTMFRPEFEEFLNENAADLGIEIEFQDTDADDWNSRRRPKRAPASVTRAISRRLTALEHVRPSLLETRIRALGRHFGLSSNERAILGVFQRYNCDVVFEKLFDLAASGRSRQFMAPGTISKVLEISRRSVLECLSYRGSLIQCGLVLSEHQYHVIAPLVGRALSSTARSPAEIVAILMGPPVVATRAWTDFEHLGEEQRRVAALLAGALEHREPAVHVLLYGASGTGKSVFAAALAAHVCVPLHTVGESGEDGDEPSRGERLATFRTAQRLASLRTACLFLVDEADDILGGDTWGFFMSRGTRAAGSKAHLHHLLETTRAPTIWTTNDIGRIDPAILRRMTYALEVKPPSPKVLTALWQREGERAGLTIGAREAGELAKAHPVPPGIVAGAIKVARLTGGGLPDLKAGVAGIARAMAGGRLGPPPSTAPAAFEPTLSTADIDLAALAKRIASAPKQPVSFCLYGAPGTGKTAFARHLADSLGLPLLQKRTSDLFSMWVGETEKAIAQAFEQAREEESLLLFDEADSLLHDRSGARQSWEVRQVNEMLTWMESHPLPFVCATNLMERLDPASLRRFVFKVRFDWLDAPRLVRAFEYFFGHAAPHSLDTLERLAPGDFALVARKARVLGVLDDAGALVRMLAAEADAKPGATKPIGFAAPPSATRRHAHEA